jgi:hypothetical protein
MGSLAGDFEFTGTCSMAQNQKISKISFPTCFSCPTLLVCPQMDTQTDDIDLPNLAVACVALKWQ